MSNRPLADRIRPQCFDDMVGQKHLFGEKGAIRRIVSSGYLPNMIFWGPPGTGKTTAANIIAAQSGMTLRCLNATSASLADVREVIAETDSVFGSEGILLYLDEIQYFNKKQQQSLLEYMENGKITLIASTTENPYIYVYNAIISRSATFEFKSVTAEDIIPALRRAMDILNSGSDNKKESSDEALEYIAEIGAGDVRRSLNYLENAYHICDEITVDNIKTFAPKVIGNFDKSGTVHYDVLSGIQKSIRGSDPDAACHYLARLLEAGQMQSACRRLMVIAAEDVGLAFPQIIPIVNAAVDMALKLGMPEARIPLGDAAILMATSPKSNSGHIGFDAALADVRKGRGQGFPRQLQNVHADTYTQEREQGYLYPHDFPNHWVRQQYLPDDIKNAKYYEYGPNKLEQAAKAYWDMVKGGK